MVLPYCFLNCFILFLFQMSTEYYGVRISILPQGHALMSILIAYLGVAKVNQAYDRYMACRIDIGRALNGLRELNQYCITLTEADLTPEAFKWRQEVKRTILLLLHSTVTMVKNSKHAQHLAIGIERNQEGDPFELILYLRSHMHNGCKALPVAKLQILELCKMLDLLHEFTISYRELVRLASTPIPFPLVQMGRTFMFIWVLSLPLVLSGKDFNDMLSVFLFVILLTYGFLGLEMVAMILANPFGTEAKAALDVKGMARATTAGIENDSSHLEVYETLGRKENLAKASFFSERILSVPTENLDDSKNELSCDSKDSQLWQSKFSLPKWKLPDSLEAVTPYFALHDGCSGNAGLVSDIRSEFYSKKDMNSDGSSPSKKGKNKIDKNAHDIC